MKRICKFIVGLMIMISFVGCVDDSTTTQPKTSNIETTELTTLNSGILLNEYFQETINDYFNDKDSFLERIESGSSLETIAQNSYDMLVPEDLINSQINVSDTRINGSGTYTVVYHNDYVEFEFTTYIKEELDDYVISSLSFDYEIVSSLTSEEIITIIETNIESNLVEINKLENTEEICTTYFNEGEGYDCNTLDFMKNGGIVYELGNVVELENGLFKVSLNQMLNSILVGIDYLYAHVSYSSTGFSYEFVGEEYLDGLVVTASFTEIDDQSYVIEANGFESNSPYMFHDLEAIMKLNEFKRKSHSSEIIYNDDELNTITYNLRTTYEQVRFDLYFVYDEFNKEFYLTILNEEIVDISEPSKYDVIQDYIYAVRNKSDDEVLDLVAGNTLPYGFRSGDMNLRNLIIYGYLYEISDQEYLYFQSIYGPITYKVDFLEEENNLILMDLDFVNMNTSNPYIYSSYSRLNQLSEEFYTDSTSACELYFDEYSQPFCQDFFTREGVTVVEFGTNVEKHQYYSTVAVRFLKENGESFERDLLCFYSYLDVSNEEHLRIVNTTTQKDLMTAYLNQLFEDIENTSVLVQDLLDTSNNQAFLEEFIAIITDVRRNGYLVEIDDIFLDYKDNFLVMNLYNAENQELEKSYFIQFDFIYHETDSTNYKIMIKNIDEIDITKDLLTTDKESYFNMLLDELNMSSKLNFYRFSLQYGYFVQIDYTKFIADENDIYEFYNSAQIGCIDANMYYVGDFLVSIATIHGYFYQTEEALVFKPVSFISIADEFISQVFNSSSSNE